jgi:hypothetical protein
VPKTAKTFEQWMTAVDAAVERLCGLSASDLPDVCYRDWYEDGISPATAARRAVRNANE